MYDGIIIPKMSFTYLDFMTQAQLKTTAIIVQSDLTIRTED